MLNLMIYATLAVSTLYCGAHASTPGDVYPEKVEEPIGASVNITCTMNPKSFPNQNSSDLMFVDVNTNENVSNDFIHVVNATSIVFVMNNASEQKTSYRCKCGTYAIMESKVYIGTPPQNVSDFVCRSFDFSYMTCNFTQPQNSMYTKYSLTYNTFSDMYYDFPCNYERQPLVVCNNSIDPHNWVENYHFKLVAKNALGNNTELFYINNLEVLIPSQPGKDFHVNRTTTDSFEASWDIPNWEYYSGSRKLQWEALVQPENLPPPPLNFSSKVIKRKNTLMHLYLYSLPYAFYWYELRLRSKLSTTLPLWSDYFVYRFRTLGKKPSRPPRTDVGSFFYVGSQEAQVRLYWEQLEEYEYNGENFTYVFSNIEKDGTSIQIKPVQFKMNSAVFEFQKNSHYKFEIRSRNHIGESQSSSYIEIFPPEFLDPKKYTPNSINSVYDNGTYTFTWKAPAESKGLVDYTVYWCYSKRAVRNECNSSLHFKHVDKETYKFIAAPQSAQQEVNLAVSANYINYNTGMHWQPCTVDVNIDLAKMEPEVQATSATTIKVQWSSENICPSVLEGYNLTYCEMLNEQIVKCWDKSIEKNMKKFEISSLRPYTQYKIEMYMYSSKKKGKVSETLFVQTKESAPSPPRILQVLQVRNTSAVISWLAPSQPNGIIRSYIVKLNNKEIVVPANKTNITLSNLVSYTSYKVFVIAKTIYPSDNSNDVHFTTLIGYPSAPATEPISDHYNETVIKWKKPTDPAGRIEYYEVAVTEMRKDQVMHRRISIVIGNTSCVMKIPRCIDNEYKTTIEVRAVNVAVLPSEVSTIDYDIVNDASHENPDSMYYDDNDEFICSGGIEHTNVNEWLQRYRNTSNYRLYKSKWQHASTYSCSKDRISKITVIALIVVLSSMSVMLAVYLGRRKYYKMANIHCTLPPGLDMYITKDSSVGGGGDSTQAQAREEEERMSGEKNIWHYNNEKHHLLDSSGSDSGAFPTRLIEATSSTICGKGTVNKEVNCTSSSGCMDNDKVAASDCKVGENLNGNGNKTCYATVQPDVSLGAPYSLRTKIDNNGGNYIKPLQIDWQLQTKDKQSKIEMITLPLTTLKPSNGYASFPGERESETQKISPIESIAITPCSYVKPCALTTSTIPPSQPDETVPKPTLEQLGKMTSPFSELPSTNAIGYTTLEQLGNQVATSTSTLPQINSLHYNTSEQFGKAFPGTNASGYTTLDQLDKTAPPISRIINDKPQINSSGYTAFEQLTKKVSPASVPSILEQFGARESPVCSKLPQQFETHIPLPHSELPLANASGCSTLEQMGKNTPKVVSSALPLTNASEYTTLQQLLKNVSQPPSTLPQTNSYGYSTLENLVKNVSQPPSTLPQTNSNGYTTLEQLGKKPCTLPKTNSNGYTTLEQLGKKPASQSVSSDLPPANLNGYTTLGELGIIATNASHDEPRSAVISGYVTQRELTALEQKGKNASQVSSSALPQTNASEYTTLENLAKNVSQPPSTLPQTNSNGYTTLEQLGKKPSTFPQTNSNGYSTLEQLGKNPASQSVSSELPPTNLNDYTTLGELGIIATNATHDEPRSTVISGYVTQRELTALEQKGKNASQVSSSVLPQTNASEYTTLENLAKNVSQPPSTLPQTNSNGYTTLEQLGKKPSTLSQTNSNGYTTLEQLGKKSASQSVSSDLPPTNLNGYTTLGELGIIATNATHDEPRSTVISGYVTQRELTALEQKGKNASQVSSSALPQTNSYEYTTLENLAKNVSEPPSTLPQTNSNGYTTLEQLGKKPCTLPQTNSNGYTTLEQLGKKPASESVSSDLPPANLNGYTTLGELGIITTNAAHDEPRTLVISGYVTQRELTAFGQKRN